MIIQADTDDQVIDAWLLLKGSVKTREQYSYQISTFLRDTQRTIRNFTLDDALSYARKLEQSDLSISTRQLRFAAAKSLFQFALRIGYLSENPLAVYTFKPGDADAARLLREARRKLKAKTLPEEVIERMIEEEPNRRYQLLVRLLYVSAGRISEVLNATWADLVPDADGKSGRILFLVKGRRIVKPRLSETLWADLQEIKGKPEERIIQSERGDSLSRQRAWKIVKQMAKRIGLSSDDVQISPHTFRHSHASNTLQAGASVAEVKEQLGHASLASTTQYIHADHSAGSVQKIGIV